MIILGYFTMRKNFAQNTFSNRKKLISDFRHIKIENSFSTDSKNEKVLNSTAILLKQSVRLILGRAKENRFFTSQQNGYFRAPPRAIFSAKFSMRSNTKFRNGGYRFI